MSCHRTAIANSQMSMSKVKSMYQICQKVPTFSLDISAPFSSGEK